MRVPGLLAPLAVTVKAGSGYLFRRVLQFQVPQQTLSNSNTYTHVGGATVHAPAFTSDSAVPDGASAKCSDGSFSFSTHRRGTRSHHGGVDTWY